MREFLPIFLSYPDSVLTEVITWVAAGVAILFIVLIVKDIAKHAKDGQPSIGAIVVKFLCLFLLIGLIYLTGSYSSIGRMFQHKAADIITEEHLPDFGD